MLNDWSIILIVVKYWGVSNILAEAVWQTSGAKSKAECCSHDSVRCCHWPREAKAHEEQLF